MYSHSEVRGVCAVCEHEPDCIYRTNCDAIVLQCAEFQMPPPRPAQPPVSVRPRLSSNNGRRPKFLGLCSNCDHRETCTYPKPEGGIWRCEEYA